MKVSARGCAAIYTGVHALAATRQNTNTDYKLSSPLLFSSIFPSR